MDKLTAILVTLIGVIWILPILRIPLPMVIANGLVAIAVLVIGIRGLISAYGKK